MKQAKVTKAFPGKPDGETKVREIAVGEIIDGDLAAVAIGQNWAEEVAAEEAKADETHDDRKKPHGKKAK